MCKIFIFRISIFFAIVFVSQGLFAQEYQKVEAESGEGIYSLLRRFNLDPKDYYNTFLEINKNRLNPDLQLLKGKTYFLPIVVDTTALETERQIGVFPIFGKKYEKVEFKDDKLQGAVFYIISGHGGPDPGAMGKKNGHTLCEDEYAYDVCLRLARNLIEHSATVYIITQDPDDGIRDEEYLKCDKDEMCLGNKKIPLNAVERLKQKVETVNQLFEKHLGQYQRKLEIHVDSRYSNQKVDIYFYYHPGSNKGKQLGETLLKTIHDKYKQHQPNRGYKGTVTERKLYTLKNTKPVSTYIELGNINHPRDLERLIIVDNRQAIANWLTLGLIKDFENSKRR
ncbi:MAG TPA: N-acetylmuramoyl-L-alanine amidase [Bacteroidales bacterium]|jgi:N-acetylmuramoyl-L-alanine amidase|nr:N-acetylmuramoyl-L-alanine amidase [Bacteroidales bacterium]NLH32477.1 N-acetylmuramoyl-L-alanine amidase [Lentimicrobium sp.]MBP7873951.1 N-acetylmuramoyl-L-alanine amidase [Bacteroidales bacterium]MCZ2283048.1 N-acetylmuramoyl-L-alanine amidase [Bacteroidales bacterium]HNY59358.1 N-acetylmuramoyl-L-alanine amidase [Bacteroidales bacterium]